jgi:UDP-glucose 4-epimerase
MVRVGVTGASGFIGGALVPFLAGKGYELRLVDNRTGPIEVTYPEWPVEGDDFQSETGLAALADCDVVLHLAAVSGVMACARDPEGSARHNVAGTARLIEACRERRIPVAFASSLAVVGAPSEFPVRESTPPRPTHEYARQKAAGEAIVADLCRDGRAPAALVRQSNVYGGYRANGRIVTKGNVLQLFAQQALTGTLSVNAPGTQRRDFVHIEDVIAHWDAILRFLLRPGAAPDATTFNVATGEGFSVLEIAGLVARTYAQVHPGAAPLSIEVVPNPRGGIELIEPEFAVSRDRTEQILGLRCRQTIGSALPTILANAASDNPGK